MTPARLSRRTFLATTATAAATSALGRIPYGGALTLALPWGVASLDPHASDDALAALLGEAVAEPVFSLDSKGRPYPTLAEAEPEAISGGCRVRLRPYLVTAAGRSLDARDLLFSIERSRARGGVAVWSEFGTPSGEPGDGLAIRVPRATPESLAHALASPLLALLPRGFSPLKPDGTGPLRARLTRGRLLLERNLRAARGPSFLDRIEVRQARDLAAALRAFEVGEVDVGWMGKGLHRPRPGAVSFDAGRFGWVILRTGRDAGSWGAPGVAQRLLDGIGPSRLTHLGLHEVPVAQGDAAWGGPPCDLLVDQSAPHLVEIARALSGHLSRPGHEVRLAPSSTRDIRGRRQQRSFALMVDFARAVGNTDRDLLLSVITAADPALARRPPRLSRSNPRQITQTLSIGVVGELQFQGAHVPEVRELESWSWGDIWRA